MKVVEHSTINRPIEKVWPYVIQPELFQKWNKKVVSMEAKGEFKLGQPFITHYQMSGKSSQMQSSATKIESGHFLELHHTNLLGDSAYPEMECFERIRLEDCGGKTIVTKEVVTHNDGMPWFLIPLIWFITRFGKRTGQDDLKVLCEAEV